MAGVIPKKSTSGRKQWAIHGSSHINSLKHLRNELASEGCPESQVVLAKQLLDEECEYKSEQKENAKLGVYWLIKASMQGNTEATDLLKICLKSGKGIDEHNYMDVKSCISMNQNEKIVRRAAKEVFASLSNGGEYITSNQLQKKMISLSKEESSKPVSSPEDQAFGDINGEITNSIFEESESEEEVDWMNISDVQNEKLTENSVVSAAVALSHGHLPELNEIMCLTEPNLCALDHIPFFYRSVLNPTLALKIFYYKLIKLLGHKFLVSIQNHKSQLLLLTLVYTFLNSENVFNIFPTFMFYLSFGIMVVYTSQMLQARRNVYDFRLWSGLFICYSNGGLNENVFEDTFHLNNIRPYVLFFMSMVVHYLCYPLVTFKFESELTVVSCCLMFICLLSFMPHRRSKIKIDPLALLSFATNVLARYPYDTDPIVSKGWRYLELNMPSFPGYVVSSSIEFCMNFRFILYSLLPIFFIKMASRNRWKGIYKDLLPHLVTLSWLQYFALFSQQATMYGLLRGTLALVGVTLFLPLVGLISAILPVIALMKWIFISNLVYTISVFVTLVTLSFVVCYICAKTPYAQYTAGIQTFIMIIACFALLRSHASNFDYEDTRDLSQDFVSWNLYQKFCYPVSEEENVAVRQERCAKLEGSHVYWEGYVSDIKIKSISNTWRNVLNKLPKIMSSHFECLFGNETDLSCNETPYHAQGDCVSFLNNVKLSSKCNLGMYDKYTFEINVKIQSGIWDKPAGIVLHLENAFKNFTLKLKPNDHIWFKGSLFNNNQAGADAILGGMSPHINVNAIGCVTCFDKELEEISIDFENSFNVINVANALYLGIKLIFNIVFGPIIVLK